MLELKNVSKFYYTKDTVASGFSKINLKLEIGEFVAITGESGSGKSTLLNVLSGLDTYEEGEMYINGEETSGYTETDFENYRKKYIGNIFQNFNLVNSYTVFQNIELVLLINGFKKREVKKKILEVIEKVDLLKYKNTKVSKLSGGQKQRVAIARALVKDTQIIVADEPTGNLDQKSAESIIELLNEISKDKLVIIVTHNYEQVEKFVTRKITMHDGKIVDDKIIKENKKDDKKIEIKTYKTISLFNKFRLGIRNTFNILPKFLLLLMVYIFLTSAVIAGYSSFKKQDYEVSNMGQNNFFQETSDKRIIIKKQNLSEFTPEEYEKIKSLNNVDYVVENDLLLDKPISFNNDTFGFMGCVSDNKLFDGKIDKGRLPENENEIIITGAKNDYMLSENGMENIFEKEFIIKNIENNTDMIEQKLKVVGIAYNGEKYAYNGYLQVYIAGNIIDEIRKSINTNFSSVETLFNDTVLKSMPYVIQHKVVPSNEVPKGKAYVSEELNYMCKNNNCKKYPLEITASNKYYVEKINVKIDKTYNKNNFKKLLKIDNFDINKGVIFVNTEDYYSLYDKGNYQSSIFIKDVKELKNTINELENLGFTSLYVKDTLVNYMGEGLVVIKALKIIISVVVIFALFFISYFIIKIILKSRNVYYSTIRILGATRKNAKQLLKIELLTILNSSYALIIGLIVLVNENFIKIDFIKELITYIEIKDYFILYAILLVISLLISNRYAKQLFKKSAMNTYREEV